MYYKYKATFWYKIELEGTAYKKSFKKQIKV